MLRPTAVLSQRATGILLVLISGASFGALGLYAQSAYNDGAHIFTVLFLRFAIASVVLLGICFARGLKFPRGKLLLAVILLGAVGYVGQATAYFSALRYAAPGLVALLLYLYPAIVAVASRVLFRERLGYRKLIALALALAGSVLTIGPVGGGRLAGVAFGIAAAVFYSAYLIASSRILMELDPTVATTIVTSAATVMFALMMGVAGPQWPNSYVGWSSTLGLALISTVIAILLLFMGMKRVGPVIASVLSATEPLVAVLLSAVLLDEQMTKGQWLGGVMILGAVIWLAVAKTSPSPLTAKE